MRHLLIIVGFLLYASIAFCQQRYVTSSPTCNDRITFGYHPDQYVPNWKMEGTHFGAFGQWFVVPATGSIDSVSWLNGHLIGDWDLVLNVSILKSNIGPTFGPGARPGDYPPPCQSWGYWLNSNDWDGGIAKTQDVATGPWVSTTTAPTPPSTPPHGEELWGFGGFPVDVRPDSISTAAMSDLSGPISVIAGDQIFISIRIDYHLAFHPTEEVPTELAVSTFRAGTNDTDYPSRAWMFYEHDNTPPSNCTNFTTEHLSRGWRAMAGFDGDSLSLAAFNIWFSMSVDTNAPPVVEDVTDIQTTFDAGPKTIQATITDCNIGNPGNAGVTGAVLRYSVNEVAQPDIPMSHIGGDTWEADLPAQPAGGRVQYRVVATDPDSVEGFSGPLSYQVVSLQNDWYSVDTAITCVMQVIRENGTTITEASFFDSPELPPWSSPTPPGVLIKKLDDGTSGPIDMGSNFVVFGDTFRYAWAGINGALALSKSPLDTLDVNSGGFYTSNWNFPSAQYDDRTETDGNMPPMFIAPFWSDLSLADTVGSCGRVVYGDNGNPCQFIVEWDSLPGSDGCASGTIQNTFRVIFNKCDGTIEFQYEGIESVEENIPFLVGLQDGSGSFKRWALFSKDGYPPETKPRSDWCIRLTPNATSVVRDGWNLVSVPCQPESVSFKKSDLFPQAISPAFSYTNGYLIRDTLELGKGYWMKFSGGQAAGGAPVNSCSTMTINVNDKWNLIGSISCFVPVGSIIPGGGTVINSPFFSYDGGFFQSSVIDPGRGYWVKVTGQGTLTLSCQNAIPKEEPAAIDADLLRMNTIRISNPNGTRQTLYVGSEQNLHSEKSYFELPPRPPLGGFDARFTATQGMAETYPDNHFTSIDIPISIQSAEYPITIGWERHPEEPSKFQLMYGGKISELSEDRTITIEDQSINSVSVRVIKEALPAQFFLSQNYPNPFNPTTEFRIELPRQSHVEVAVFDLLGRKIASLLNEEKSAGKYRLEWNGQDSRGLPVPTGMYFIRMIAGEFTDSKKVIFMK